MIIYRKKIWSKSNLDNNEQVVLNRFNSVLQKLTPYSGSKVYRVYSNSSYLEEKQLSFFKNNLNEVFEINAYLGTSSKPMEDYTECIWEIQLSSPSRNRSLRFENLGFDGYDSEEEIIFLPCTKFKIMNVRKNTVLLQETGEEVSCILPVS